MARTLPPRPGGLRERRRALSVRARTVLAAAVLCVGAAGWSGASRIGSDPAAAREAAEPSATDAPATNAPAADAPAALAQPPVASRPAPAAGLLTRPTERSQVREAVAQRIDGLHRKLRITPGEQALWDQFADTMLRNALDSEGRFRAHQAQPAPDAASGLAERAQAAQARADMLQHLSASFRALYEAMPPDQRLLADQVFRQAQRQEGRHGPSRMPQE
ncbi:MAG: hypothetical protein ACRYG6_07070 [Janthinobacterium lividum]